MPKLLAETSDLASALRQMTTPEVASLIARANNEGWNYEDCCYRAPLIKLAPDQFWILVKWSRETDRIETPIRDTKSRAFSFRLPPEVQRKLHAIDLHLGGLIGGIDPQLESETSRARYVFHSLREEAIHSSLIEGAVVTRQDAEEMLRTQRQPRTDGERMVLNNYRTILMLNQRKNEPMTMELLGEIQRSITEGTLKKPESAGRFRRPDENITIVDEETNEIIHFPPSADELSVRMQRLCDFANDKQSMQITGEFYHPAIRAILLHFWLAYDHPFVDGNGRTARALFYWSMLNRGYWLTEYLAISSIINRQVRQYYRAFLNTEYDDNDVTYFILYHLDVIQKSISELHDYLKQKTAESHEYAEIVKLPLNQRQRAIVIRALKYPATIFTYASHANSHGIAPNTAKADLLELASQKLLLMRRTGRAIEFVSTRELKSIIEGKQMPKPARVRRANAASRTLRIQKKKRR